MSRAVRAVDVWWDKTGWLPRLQTVKWARLETLRVEHEKAVKARDADPTSAVKLEALCEVVERACEDLDRYWSELEEACGTEKVRGQEAEADQRALETLVNRTLSRRILDQAEILTSAAFESRKALSELGAAA